MDRDGHLVFAATDRVAELLRGRGDIEFRAQTACGPDEPGGTVVLLAMPTDDVHGTPPADGVRLAVLADAPIAFEDGRFDDYVFMSTPWPEIVVRATTALRRKRRATVCLQPASLEVRGCSIRLSVTEHRLMACLLERAGAPVSRTDLEHVVSEAPDVLSGKGESGRALDAHVYRLRRKLRDVPGVELATLRQRGFSLSIEDPYGRPYMPPPA